MDIAYIKTLTEIILNKSFKDTNKKAIITYDNRINFCCPICGDSTKSASKKRGNIFFDKLLYVCFRCGHTSSFNKLCKHFDILIDPTKKIEMIEHLNSVVSKSDCKTDMSEVNFDDLINMEDLEKILNSNEKNITHFHPISKNSAVYNYLSERGITSNMCKDIYEAKHWLSEDRYEPVMVFLNKSGNKILGMQTRNLKSGKWRSFKIYTFETLYRWVNNLEHEEIENVDLNQLLIFNKLSNFFNILNINFEEKITIFEGYLDSLFYPNSIGVVGVNTPLSVLENNNLDIQFFYDNDSAGNKKSNEKIKLGYKVFLWNKLFENVVSKKKINDPYSLMYRVSKIKDLNELSKLVEDPYKKLSLNEFFSKDIYDIKWITKTKIFKK